MKYVGRPQSKQIVKKIYAAEGDFNDENNFDLEDVDSPEEGIADSVDDMAEQVEDLQDTIDDASEPDDVNIDTYNNIAGHYIAECEKCHQIFISAVVESDQQVSSIQGICPFCNEDTTQDLKWVVVPTSDR